MKNKWIPQTQFPKKIHNCLCNYIGYDERQVNNIQTKIGLFVDIETYDSIETVTIYFERAEYYSWSDELRRRKTLYSISCNFPGLHQYMVFNIENSSLLRWFYEESNFAYSESDNPAKHYVILTTDDFIDIVTPIDSMCYVF